MLTIRESIAYITESCQMFLKSKSVFKPVNLMRLFRPVRARFDYVTVGFAEHLVPMI